MKNCNLIFILSKLLSNDKMLLIILMPWCFVCTLSISVLTKVYNKDVLMCLPVHNFDIRLFKSDAQVWWEKSVLTTYINLEKESNMHETSLIVKKYLLKVLKNSSKDSHSAKRFQVLRVWNLEGGFSPLPQTLQSLVSILWRGCNVYITVLLRLFHQLGSLPHQVSDSHSSYEN